MPSVLHSLRRSFVADHFHDLPGFVEARHGHNWEVEATVHANTQEGFSAFTTTLDAWVDGVDYTLLNELPRLSGRNPTTELLAQWALEHLEAAGFQVERVKVREKANYWASCAPEAR